MAKLHYNDLGKQEWLHHLRTNELEMMIKNIPSKESKILEVGGGDGFIASSLADRGFNITSVDLNPRYPQSFPVWQGDGTKMGFSDESFDAIITVHVLPNVGQIRELLGESSRVLKNDGVMIHVVPSSFWVMITSFWHIVLLPKNLFQIYSKKIDSRSESDGNTPKKCSKVVKLLKYVFLHPVGVRKSAVHEFICFRKKSWSKIFLENKMEIKNIASGPEIYTGHSTFKERILDSRKKFAKGPITSSYCYVLTKRKETR